MNTLKIEARTFGIFFILAFVSYGLGSSLVESIISTPDVLTNIYENKSRFIVGIILMALIHSFVIIGSAVIMLPILKPYNRYLAYGYFSAAIIATIVLIVGAISLLLLLPLSDEFTTGISANITHFELITSILKNGGFFAYQIGMAIWGIGGLLFCILLNKSKLVPQWLTIWGLIGYAIFISGTIAELYGMPIGVQLSLPGGLFEIVLSLWLIIKGFNFSNEFADTRNGSAHDINVT
ncbi:MAG: DUF4386 domain-containing protein [Gammaproteobacteria bacterium]|nr:DUF4386 domain-containing protein [Gammaproteobacteria bacterium]